MKKKFLTVIAVALALISLSACAKKTNGVEEENKKETAENINQKKEDDKKSNEEYIVENGSQKGSAFQQERSLEKSNGSEVNFWIKNKGEYPVEIKIDGDYPAIVEAGKDGETSAPIKKDKVDYKFSASSTEGGDIDIDFKIVQSN
ncbi:MAG: hypothetical protein E6249_00580 [Peptoniphilus grossensis]|uniref:hypothetical protein n=1 Tax=Peptoniphilus grossensis TaxID=1465756 RepID=UPI00290DB4B5|nr:hypothetical protein [Peptoniphilus grossensis]MDU5098946.1 hypothetical protein [Peptoniphilus grossensis]